jgi:uncharacterized Zn-finger protein
MPDQALWNHHPKVYLPLKGENKEVKCPYCGTIYSLEK